jgi:2'-hydroxyisoflavone reductase
LAVILLAPAVEHYTFVSSISVYADFSRPGMNESAPVGTLTDESVEEVTGETYGPLKALSERAVEESMPGKALVLRPGLIVGPDDPTDRFTYWPHRVAQGGEVLTPGRPERIVQFIDVRDLGEWVVRMAEARATGIYNATGPAGGLTMERLLNECKSVSGSGAQFAWIDEQFLLDEGVQPWTELPLWAPGRLKSENSGLLKVDVGRAVAAGLTFRPLAHTVRDTLEWNSTQPPGREWKAGMTPKRERELLQAWKDR